MKGDLFGILGQVVAGTYLIEQVVASRASAVVYRAYHRGFRARVALKCLDLGGQLDAVQRERFFERFRANAEVLFRLSAVTPTVVRPLHVESFQLSGRGVVPFLALEWLDGWTLDAIMAQRIAQGRPPIGVRKLVRMLTPVARAIEQTHALPGPRGAHVVHGDLKPQNLFVAFIGGEQVVKILDFGIGSESAQGAYSAPEQYLPSRFGPSGTWTDVWGLALTMVSAIKGGAVFTGAPEAVRAAIVDPRNRPVLQEQGLRIPDELELIFRRALAVEPKDRYPTIRGFWDDLLDALDLDSNGQPRWVRRQDPRVEGPSSEVDPIEASSLPRLTALLPRGLSHPPPDSSSLPKWQPPPALDALEFAPPPRRSEWPLMLSPLTLGADDGTYRSSSGDAGVSSPPPTRAFEDEELTPPELTPATVFSSRRPEPDSGPTFGLGSMAPSVRESISSFPDVPALDVPKVERPSLRPPTEPPSEVYEEPQTLDADRMDFVDRSTLPPSRGVPIDPGKSAGVASLPPVAEPQVRSTLSPRTPSGAAPAAGVGSRRPTAPPAWSKAPPTGTVRWGWLLPAIGLLVIAVIIAMLNQRHGSASGGASLYWGPLRATWVSLAFFIVAVVLATFSLKRPVD